MVMYHYQLMSRYVRCARNCCIACLLIYEYELQNCGRDDYPRGVPMGTEPTDYTQRGHQSPALHICDTN